MIIGFFTLLVSTSQGAFCVWGGCSLLPFGELVVKQFIYSVQANSALTVLTQYKGHCVRGLESKFWDGLSRKLIRSKFSHMTYINTKVPGRHWRPDLSSARLPNRGKHPVRPCLCADESPREAELGWKIRGVMGRRTRWKFSSTGTALSCLCCTRWTCQRKGASAHQPRRRKRVSFYLIFLLT